MASGSVAARLDSINGSDYIEDSERFRIDAKKFLNELNDCLYIFSKIDTSFFKEHSKEIYHHSMIMRY